MSKAGKGDGVDAGAVGSQHPVPENIPHLSSPIQNASASSPGGSGSGSISGAASGSLGGSGSSGSLPKHGHHGSIPGIQAGSPIKESSFLNRETSVDDQEDDKDATKSPEPLGGGEGLPIRR